VAPNRMGHTMTTTELRITRTPLPSVEAPVDETQWGRHDTYAVVAVGAITAEVVRFTYWPEPDATGRREPESEYEVSINGMPDNNGGMCELYATEPQHLLDVAAVCAAAAMLLDEVRQQYPSEVSA
jgi:hypothetical protein